MDAVAEYVDPDGRTVSIDERFFMEWVELGFKLIRDRLNAEDRMDEIDKRKRGASDGSQEQVG